MDEHCQSKGANDHDSGLKRQEPQAGLGGGVGQARPPQDSECPRKASCDLSAGEQSHLQLVKNTPVKHNKMRCTCPEPST